MKQVLVGKQNMQGSAENCWGVPGRVREVGWRSRTEEEGRCKITESSKVIDGEGEEGDEVSIKVGNKEGRVDLGCMPDELASDASFVCSMKGVR